MNFRLDPVTNDLAIKTLPTGAQTLDLIGGVVSDGIIKDPDEVVQAIKTELLLWFEESPRILGRGTDWFAILRNSKLGGIQALQEEISTVILRVRSVHRILAMELREYGPRHYRIWFRVNTKSNKNVEGEAGLN